MSNIKKTFLTELHGLESKYKGKFRARRAVCDRIFEACDLLDVMFAEFGGANAMLIINPESDYNATIRVEQADMSLDCRTDKNSIDALTGADTITFSQNKDTGNLVIDLCFEDLWVVTR